MPFIINKHIVPFSDIKQIEASDLNQDYKRDIINFLEQWYDPLVSTISLKTSGSTGIPKNIKLPKKMMIASATKTQKYFGYLPGSKALLCLPVNFIAGKMMIVRSIISDLDLIVQDPQSNPIQHQEDAIDFVAMTPHQLGTSLSESKTKLNHLKTILLGGAPVSKKLELEIQEIQAQCYLSYGMTETASHVAIRKINSNQSTSFFEGIDGVNFSVGSNGCLIIEGDHFDELIYTNDIVDLIDSHSFYYKGRIDNIINSGGIKVNPEDIEAQLSKIINYNYIVSSRAHETLGEQLILIIETINTEQQNLNKNELIAKIKHRMKGPIKPESIITVPKFIYSASGKILRSETTKLALQLSS